MSNISADRKMLSTVRQL